MIKLSIIVPFYNVEPYIEQCIRSMYEQDIPLDEYEVICVDDCSPDGSRAIVERLQKEYSNLQLICHTENKRQGGARNTGLCAAKGEYVWFVDSDDYILPNVLNILYTEASKDSLDILHFNFDATATDGTVSQHILRHDDTVYTGSSFALDPYYDTHINFSLCWSEIIRREYLLEHNILFAEYMQFEDADYAYQLYGPAKRVKQSDLMPYHYITREGSTMNSVYTARKMRDHVMTIVRSELMLPRIDDVPFRNMVLRYVLCELSQAGKRVVEMPLKERIKYVKLINRQPLKAVRHHTSWRNWLRIRYGMPV